MQDTTTTQETATAPVQEFKWYVLRVINGKEKKVKEYLDKEMELSRKDGKEKWANNIKRLFLPVEKVYKVQKGKKVIREKNYYPGYVMIEVDGKLTDDAISNIKNTTNVIHFLGKENPVALRKAEVDKMLGNVDQMSEGDSIMHAEHFIRGDSIKIIDGPFKDFNGAIEEVNDEKKRLKVNVKIFGRNTPVELTFMQVEKLS
jgi:transcriptional antiterminator NusG